MKLTIHKCVLNAMTAPNPTQYTKSDKYKVKTKNRDWYKFVRNWISFIFVVFFGPPGHVLVHGHMEYIL